MPQYFINEKLSVDEEVSISDQDYYHLVRVRRVKIDDNVLLRDNTNNLFKAIIKKIDDDKIIVKLKELISRKELQVNIVLAVALLKGKKFDLVIQKATEVGVSAIIPLVTERTIPEIKGKEKNKTDRWNKIAIEASKQCLRDDIPQVCDIQDYKQFIKSNKMGIKIFAHTDQSSQTIRNIIINNKSEKSAVVVIGPEGGFSENEIALAIENQWNMINFGTTQLRAETAAIVIPAITLYEMNLYMLLR